MNTALEGGKWSAARPGRTLLPGKSRYALYRRLGRNQGRSGRAENLVPTGIRSQDRPARSPTELPGPHEDLCTFMIMHRRILLRMKNIWDKNCRKKSKHMCYVQKVSGKSCRLWDNFEKYGTAVMFTDDNTIQRMRMACWIIKATDTHSEYVKHLFCMQTMVLRTLPIVTLSGHLQKLQWLNLRTRSQKCPGDPSSDHAVPTAATYSGSLNTE